MTTFAPRRTAHRLAHLVRTCTRRPLGALLCCAAAGSVGCSDGGPSNTDDGCASLLAGDLIITEVMANPAGEDRGFEWFEIHNPNQTPVDLEGLTLTSSLEDETEAKNHAMSALFIEGGDYLVLAGAEQDAKPSFADYGFGNRLGLLRNAGGRLALSCGDTLIDEAIYPSAEGKDGVAFGLDGSVAPNHLSNDEGANFCPATTEFSDGNFGSPGEANQSCGIEVPGTCDDDDGPRPVVAPEAGDLIITEFMANPAGVEQTSEWFEVLVTRPVDLNGVVVGVVPGEPKLTLGASARECLRADAGDYLVFSRSATSTDNGGLPVVDHTFGFSLKNGTTATGPGSLFVGVGEVVLDQVTYETSTDGASASLDPSKLDTAANDDSMNFCDGVEPYGEDGNAGSPGKENPACPPPPPPCTNLVTGELVITEVMANPTGADTGAEWFEIYNATAETKALVGLELANSLADGTLEQIHQMGELQIEPGDYLVLSDATSDPLPAHVDYSYGGALGALRQDGGRLTLRCGETEVDQATYPGGSEEGVSVGVDGQEPPTAATNNTADDFCPATTEFQVGLIGTPGAVNDLCVTGPPTTCQDGGVPRPTVPPVVGDLIITEFLADPMGTDDPAEWFEVYVTREVDLNGLVAGVVQDAPAFSVDSPDCVTAAAGDYLVFARTDEANNGGLPRPDFLFDFPLKNGTTQTGPGLLYVQFDQTVLDAITYDSATTGASTTLDPSALTTTDNDDPANWCLGQTVYGTVDDPPNLGSPGSANPACPVVCATDQCFDEGTAACRAIVQPTAGQILVTEALANPKGTGTEVDPAHEWFELMATAAFDLNGLQLGKGGVLSQTIGGTECLPVTPGQVLVFAHGSDPVANGALPQVDYLKSFQLTNSASSVDVGVNDVVLHSLSWSSSTDGVSLQLDPDGTTTCPSPEVAPYGTAEDLGSPGLANNACIP